MIEDDANTIVEDRHQHQKRDIINKFLCKLNQEEPQMYYATTDQIARSLHLMIKEHTNRLSVEEQALVRHLSIEEVQGMLSFHLK